MSGYVTTQYESNISSQTLVETSEGDLTAVFETAKENGGTLDGAEKTIDAAIDNPLGFLDYLILVDGSIEFDDGHVRETQDSTSS